MKTEKIKPEDLRIGNWIDTIEGPVQVWGIMKEGVISTSFYDGGDLLGFAEPILITEEWLHKLGFKMDSLTDVLVNCRIGFFELWYFPINNSFMVENIKNKKLFIQYVHQLQNLYFALTGEELTLKQ